MKTIHELRTAFKEGEYTPSDAVATSLDCIKDKDNDIHAFLDVYGEEARTEAAAATTSYHDAPDAQPALLGVPIALKNNILYAGHRATGGSKILQDYTATYTATVVERLKAAGAIIIGSTNMDEFAMGSSTENSAFGPTKNPHDTSRVPGGSSGGSAAAVAMGAVPAALGTDTGGSIRQPASFCGVVGFKPTYGALSRHGLMAMGSSFDQAGPLTHSVADAELLHTIMAGPDSYDATTIADTTYESVEVKSSYTIGIPRRFLAEGVDDDVMAVFAEHEAALQAAGHTIVDIDLPLFARGLAAYYISMPAEVSSNLARYDGIRYGLSTDTTDLLERYQATRGAGFGAEVKRRILLGTYVLSAGYVDAYYAKAEAVREAMRAELREVFASVDMILTPTAPTPAFAAGEMTDPVSMYKQDIFTVPVNLTGVPALSIPAGTVDRAEKALPVGVQYIAPHSGEARLFALGKQMYDQTQTS